MPQDTLAGLAILVVEDEPLLRKQLTAQLERLGADVTGAANLSAARQLVSGAGFDFALIDVNLPDGRGPDLLQEKAFPPNTGVIIMTANGAIAGAVEAIRLGALDYLVKPFDPLELPLVIARARRAKQSSRADEHRRDTGAAFFFGSALAGLEAQLQRVLAADRRMQGPLPPVLIQGETGTGKTTIARWLHQQGPRAAEQLLEVNCSALPETLAESELFGHERGAFTDARSTRMGLFEAAQGGTLFLDELPSLSPALQAKVLTAIEDRAIRRVGANKTIAADVRIIAATNRDLKQLVEQGKFREDLFHRLDLYRIILPPLRDRGEDILKLADLLMRRLWQRHRLAPKKITPAGRQRLLAYRWSGNVRELAHELERAIVFEYSEELNFEGLQVPIDTTAPVAETDWLNPDFRFPAQGFSLESAIVILIQQALKQSGNNVSAAARLLGVSRDYLRYRLAGKKSEE
ncbi:MAG TPA: sigma-54 dependent transcriptional regulator [Candidatus Binatia bacterium]|jgi:DNA-binding NtrC family response regulator|nr:sigma-54 dependent transcriptional regulator [Candidatus Binatia bacterium]